MARGAGKEGPALIKRVVRSVNVPNVQKDNHGPYPILHLTGALLPLPHLILPSHSAPLLPSLPSFPSYCTPPFNSPSPSSPPQLVPYHTLTSPLSPCWWGSQ